MLTRLVASRYDRPAATGRTRPLLAAGVSYDGTEAEVILKCSAGCDRGVKGLACEVISACLAADLGLPVPTPFLVELTPAWIATISDDDVQRKLRASSSVAFGSGRVAPGFGTWSTGTHLRPSASHVAAMIFAFDAFIQNSDRRPDNPNLLVRGDDLRIIDHELAFSHGLVIGWAPPWHLGGLQSMSRPGAHVLAATVRRLPPDWAAVRAAFSQLADDRLDAYRNAIPTEWAEAGPLVADACRLIAGVRDRIDDCLTELQRILS